MIATTNDDQAVVSSTYWASELAHGGKVYASVNAGAVRLLLPDHLADVIPREVAAAGLVLISVGPWPAAGLSSAVEILWEDGTESPYALQLAPASFDLLPADPGAGTGWVVTTWDFHEGKPRKRTEHGSKWRRVPSLPWLRPL